MCTGGDSPEIWRHGVGSVDYAALTVKETLMDIIAILEIGATAALLVAHLAIVVRNRFIERA
jgi:hypothetical protein